MRTLRNFIFAICIWSALVVGELLLREPCMPATARAKVSRIKSDLRTLATAIEAYYVDNHVYPADSPAISENAFGVMAGSETLGSNLPTFRLRSALNPQLHTLTTPVAYLKTETSGNAYFVDPLAPVKGQTYCYWVWRYTEGDRKGETPGWILWAAGPDGDYDVTTANVATLYSPLETFPSPALIQITYDPSNGSTSDGDVYRCKQ